MQMRYTDEYNGIIIFFLVAGLSTHIVWDYFTYHAFPSTMDQIRHFLQAVGYHAALIQPLLPMYIHLIVSAIFPIYAGAHASLSRPSSAASPPRKKKGYDEDDEPEDQEQKMEGLTPSDAIMLPLLGGLSLTGLYFLIKWLEDPAILNKVLNWYFAIFGVLSLARLLTDIMTTVHSFFFPAVYVLGGQLWEVDGKQKMAKTSSTDSTTLRERDSPLPGSFAMFPFPPLEKRLLWIVRDLPSRKLRIRAYLHSILSGDFKIGSHGISALLLATLAQLYFNLVDKPWWLTNLLGFSFAYTTLQIMTPTTSWTGTLILGGLFIYDIYFVFFTPLMVTVATKLDIPAKLIFPRPGSRGMSMLGLGDVVLPGMMIGFALRFDLYLFYLRKQTEKAMDIFKDVKSSEDHQPPEKTSKDDSPKEDTPENTEIVKSKWHQATGNWGERYWTRGTNVDRVEFLQGGVFPKTYFHASLVGYVVGMIFTLLVMQVFSHAQPALLYLVPGTVGALWGTALVNGDIKTLWAFSEAEEEEEEEMETAARPKEEGKAEQDKSGWLDYDWITEFLPWKSSTKAEQSKNPEQASPKEEVLVPNGHAKQTKKPKENIEDDHRGDKSANGLSRDRKTELVFFSINLPQDLSTKTPSDTESDEVAKPALARRKRREMKTPPKGSDFNSSDERKLRKTGGERRRRTDIARDDGLGETY